MIELLFLGGIGYCKLSCTPPCTVLSRIQQLNMVIVHFEFLNVQMCIRMFIMTTSNFKRCVAAVINLPDFIYVLLYFPGPSAQMNPRLYCCELNTANAGAKGWGREMMHFSVSVINRLNKTEYAILTCLYFVWWLSMYRLLSECFLI